MRHGNPAILTSLLLCCPNFNWFPVVIPCAQLSNFLSATVNGYQFRPRYYIAGSGIKTSEDW